MARAKPRAPRTCSVCHRTYYRSNRLRLWVKRNPGHRDGWQKVDDPICLKCLSPKEVTALVNLANVSYM